MKSKSELEFEQEVIDYLTQIGGAKQWEYKKEIKTTNDLWENFKLILEKNNQARLENPLSKTEFNQIKKIISDIDTPYKAGQFLYGVNGVSEIEVDLDNGKHVFLTVFDQEQIGGGNTVYQIVNQIERPKVIDGKKDRRFDVTLLINGLPIIQIELKAALHTANESLNQMEQYIAEKQYTGIYSTLQVLIAMTPYDVRYMANTKLKSFNRAFAFKWQDEKSSDPIYSWRDFSDKVLSIPMAHELATRFMILDGTKNKESVKVMRPYQVYATRRVLERVRNFDFSYGNQKIGYVWHTTGSGKTITSFKTAWLVSRLPNVRKVIFLVDRIALTNQTVDAYKAYDPVAGFEGKSGVIGDVANVSDLHNKLTKKSDKNIIVTSIQKMARYVQRKDFKPLNDNIVFIVDEAHRSTGTGDSTGMLEEIRKAIPNSAWIGYTGTPKFPETQIIFGDLLHAYTIKEAIADRNVLGFNVEFKETIPEPENKEEFLTDDVRGSIYDTREDHVDLVVKDIFDNWQKRSNNGKYNALLTVHVGGGKASTPRAMEYFRKFEEINNKIDELNAKNEKQLHKLKVAISFSLDTSNGDNQRTNNENLHYAITSYNKLFGTDFDMTTHQQYTEDLARRLNKTSDDGNFLDLVIVVDRLLTGFDAPELNTLYVDRVLKDGNLIQAYSRTNRMHNLVDKPWGNVVNYRWPVKNEEEMNKAFVRYSNKDSADVQMSLEQLKEENQNTGVLSKPFSVVLNSMQEVVSELSSLTNDFRSVPKSEKNQEIAFEKLKEYNSLLSQLKQYTEDETGQEISAYDEDKQEDFYKRIGITKDQEIILTVVIAQELKERRAKKEKIDISQINLDMVHIHEVEIDYDYLVKKIAEMANKVYEDKVEEAEVLYHQIDVEIAKLEIEKEKVQVKDFVERIFKKDYVFNSYPVELTKETLSSKINELQNNNNFKLIAEFGRYWGLDETINPTELDKMIQRHRYGQEDMDNQNELTNIMNNAREYYKKIASAEVASLSWLSYRREFRKAFYSMADKIKK